MPFYNNARRNIKNPLTENLFFDETFSGSANPVSPLPILTEDNGLLLTEDDDDLFTEGDL